MRIIILTLISIITLSSDLNSISPTLDSKQSKGVKIGDKAPEISQPGPDGKEMKLSSLKGQIVLIDEIHTPDSSRYFLAEGYAERQASGEAQQQLSKEFVRQFLIANGFQGKEGQPIPELTDAWAQSVSERYIQLFELVTGKTFIPADQGDIPGRIQTNVEQFLSSLKHA